MIEKVNPCHPDKIADRIAGALVDYCYAQQEDPKCAFEVLIGHGSCLIIGETSVRIPTAFVEGTVERISKDPNVDVEYVEVPQDPELSKNQSEQIKAGDNGIFKGVPVRWDIQELSDIARAIFDKFPTDGKYILSDGRLIVCQSNATNEELEELIKTLGFYKTVINPLGYWTGGIDVDTGAVNRKLGSDMGEAVTGGGLHGKDLSKADVSVNIYAHLKAQETGKVIEISCAIGDETVDGKDYGEIVEVARSYIQNLGGFEKLAEWGIV